MDGDNASIIVSSAMTYPTAITVDEQLGFIYWADEAQHVVRRTNFAGSSQSTVITLTAGSVVGGQRILQ